MFSFFGFIIFFIFICYYILKNSNVGIKTLFSTYMNYMSNMKLLYSDGSILLYRGDKDGENFVFALKNNSSTFSSTDIYTLYEKAEKLHIHNKILITDYPIDSSSTIYKKVREYKIAVWNSSKLSSLINAEYGENSSYTPSSSSALKTSDTSDDNCDIDESNDPIQDGAFNTHGIFSLLGNKPDRL